MSSADIVATTAPARPIPTPGTEQTRFRWFVTLWVMAFTFHYFSNKPTDMWPVLLAGIPCLLLPGSVVCFGIFLVVGGAVAAVHLPAASNHLVLALLVHLAFAGAAVTLRRGGRTAKAPAALSLPERWVDTARTPVGLTILVVYFFGVFHKLNTSFFDPAVSCTGGLIRQLVELQGFDASGIPDALVVAGAVLTVVTEAAILVLLAFPRWRRFGVLLGVGFHGILAWARFYDFTGFTLALYILLLPREASERVPGAERWRRLALAGWTAHAVVGFAAYASNDPSSPLGLRWHTLQVLTWMAAVGPLVGPLLRSSFARAEPLPCWRWSLRPAWLLVVPLLAYVNGLTPYLGLKTVANYSMFSNLRTEGGRTNHLIGAVGALKVTDLLRDTVEVRGISSKGPELGWFQRARGGEFWLRRQTRWDIERPVTIPWIELRRSVQLWKDAGMRDIQIAYIRAGAPRLVRDAENDPQLTEPLPPLTRYLVAFRAIERAGDPVRCRW